MGGSVGKPTLCVDQARALAKLIEINFGAWFQVGYGSGKREIVSCANQCGNPSLPLCAIRSRARRKWAEPSPLREAKRRGNRFAQRMCVGRNPVVVRHAGIPKLLRKPPLA